MTTPVSRPDSGNRHVVLVSANYHPRICGVGDHTMRVAESLATVGFEATVLSRPPVEVHPDGPSVRAIGLPPSGRGDHVAPMLEWLARARPSLVVLQYTPQAFDGGRLGGTAPLRLAAGLRRLSIPVLLLAHELFVPWSVRPDRMLAAISQRILFALLARRATRVAVTTETRLVQVRRAMRMMGGGARVLEVIPVGAGALPVRRVPGDHFRIGTFGTLAQGKRLDVVLGAFALVAQRDPTATLTILGDVKRTGDRASVEFERAVAAHPARDRISVPGRLPLSEVSEAMSRLDAFAFPMDTGANTRSSTLPVALGAGVPSVAIRGKETDDRFVDRANVLFAGALTAEEFGAALESLRLDPVLARTVGEGGRQLYDERLGWRRISAAIANGEPT